MTNDGMPEMNDPGGYHAVTIAKDKAMREVGGTYDDFEYRPIWRGECSTCLWVGEWEWSEKHVREVAQRHHMQTPDPEPRGDRLVRIFVAFMCGSVGAAVALGMERIFG